MSIETAALEEFSQREYKHGFVTDIEADTIPSMNASFRPAVASPTSS
jgi:hypothetical protein